MKLHSKSPYFPVATFLLCLYLMFSAQSALANPNVSNWSVRLHTEHPDQSHEIRNLEATSSVPRTFRGFVEYTADINISKIDQQSPLGIYLGQIAEADEVYLNGKLIGSMGAFPPHYTNFMDVDRIYLLPPHLLQSEKKNLLRVVVYTEYFVKKGFDISRVEIGPIAQLQQKQYFSTIRWNLTRLILPSLCFLLILLSFSAFRTKGGLYASLLLLLASSFFVFGVSRSRFTFHIFDLLTSYKLLTLSSVTGACILVFFVSHLSRPKQWFWPTLACITTAVYWTLILPQESIESVSRIYVPSWYYVGTGLLFACSLFLAPQMRHKYRIVAFGIWILTLLGINDTLEMLFRINTPFLFDIGMSFFLGSLIVERIFDMKNELVKAHKEQAYFLSQKNISRVAIQVAHDIRSPLSAMGSAIDYFGHLKMPDEKGTKVLNILELSAKRLTGIADDLLKNHQGKEAGEGTVFSIHHILDELIGEFEGLEQYKEVRFVKRYDSDAIHIRGDGAKLQRAFGNILKNAAEAMEFHGTITVTTQASEDRASVGIADTGPGMSEEKLQKVLVGGFTEGKEDGHGIGTKVVKETVAEHHGTLRAESRIGEGTTFFIDLPRVTQTLPVTTFTLTLNPQERVLIVDDEASLREQWRLILEGQGINTLLCKSYEDVVEQGIGVEITTTAIVDYHFNNSERNGVDVVKYLQSVGFTNLTLCTAEYWKPQLQRENQELGVPICPKPIPTIVIAAPEQAVIANPEGVKQSRTQNDWIASLSLDKLGTPRNDDQKNYNVLVIDDELAIRMSWELKQQMLRIGDLHCYANLEELQSNGIDLTIIDISFVDKNIAGSAHTAAEVIRFLREKGIPKIILASGESRQALEQDPLFHSVDGVLTEKIPKDLRQFFD